MNSGGTEKRLIDVGGVAAAIDRVRIFDTTLRDGEQAPGFSMTEKGKLKMARALAALKVDVIEAGFAAASPGEARSIANIARAVEGPTICALARTTRSDILHAANALEGAERRRIHLFLGTSQLHHEAKLKMRPGEVLARIAAAVAFARELVDDVEFSAEDAIRTERDFLAECLSLAAASGAQTLNVPDTVGYTTPDEIYDLFRFLGDHVDRPQEVIFSAHCHNDLGMAVANSLAAVCGGARQVECAVNGIGERAGNCALEEVVMALKARADWYGVSTGIDAKEIMAASRTLAQVTNNTPSRNKAIVGANAFTHESGIHQHGVLQNRETYEIMKPEDIGLATEGLVLGKHSGRHAIAARAEALGFTLSGEQLDRVFAAFKEVADQVGLVDSARLVAIIAEDGETRHDKRWTLRQVDIRSPKFDEVFQRARVELDHRVRGRTVGKGQASGALDAALAAVSQAMEIPARVASLQLHYIAADPGDPVRDGQGANVLVEIEIEVCGEIFAGRSRARDILPSCVSAFIDAVSNAQAVRETRGKASVDRPRSAVSTQLLSPATSDVVAATGQLIDDKGLVA